MSKVNQTKKQELFLIKIGGNIIDDELKLAGFLKAFASISEKKILIHGGGKLATKLAKQLNIHQEIRDGRRITDAGTLRVVTMVYAGFINKNIVATLQAHDCNALGLCGADGNSIMAHKRNPGSAIGEPGIDYGFVGDVDTINLELLELLLSNGLALVFAPLTHDSKGQLLNTNADTIAKEIAKTLSKIYNVTLVYSFEKKGVLTDPGDEDSVIARIDPRAYEKLKTNGAIVAGMIPKLDNAFGALAGGVQKVIIGNAEEIHQLIQGETGTTIIK